MDSSDIELMQRCLHEDEAALSELYRRYSTLIYSLALRILQNPILAEEVAQDIFMEIWKRPASWDPSRGRLSSWLLTVTRYTAIDRLRKEQRSPDASTPLDETQHAIEDPVADPIWQDGQLLRALIKKLPPEQAQAIELAFFQGMTHSQMAERLALPLGTVKTRVRLGLQKLRALWEENTIK